MSLGHFQKHDKNNSLGKSIVGEFYLPDSRRCFLAVKNGSLNTSCSRFACWRNFSSAYLVLLILCITLLTNNSKNLMLTTHWAYT